MISWLDVGSSGGATFITLDESHIKNYISEKIAPQINKEPKTAKFQIDGGRVAQFEPGQDGLEIKIEDTIEKIEAEFLNGRKNEIELIVGEVKNTIGADEVNNLGIKEIIGTGESDFSGSPANRLHNIRTGANSLNGVLIKPDEEFSLLNALGAIDGNAGYKQELVIKNNKTVPEYGGGLCQIGTTMFRGSLASGL
ncbi:MAG: VanW family protein, partial [Patescibacteria group bacterium]